MGLVLVGGGNGGAAICDGFGNTRLDSRHGEIADDPGR